MRLLNEIGSTAYFWIVMLLALNGTIGFIIMREYSLLMGICLVVATILFFYICFIYYDNVVENIIKDNIKKQKLELIRERKQ